MKRDLPWNLIIANLRGDISNEEDRLLKDWLKIESNYQIFQQLKVVWENIQNKSARYEPDVEYYWEKLYTRIHNTKEEVRGSENSHSVKFISNISIKRFYRIVAAASVILAIIFSGTYYFYQRKFNRQALSQNYSSLNGKLKVVLPDGSVAWLHSNTTISYNFEIASGIREVHLNGEAFFSVKHDTNKPFIVKANDVSVKVYGTKFNMDACRYSGNVLVSLCEGSVSMCAANKYVNLKPGYEGLYDKRSKTLKVKPGDVGLAKSWTNEQLRFKDKSLRYVCRYLSKWYSVRIDVDFEMPDNQLYTFTLHDETLEEILGMMSCIHPIDYQFIRKDELIIKLKK